MFDFLKYFWETTIQSSLLIVLLLFLRFVIKGRLDARLQYGLWLVVALRLLIPISIPSPLSVMNTVQPIISAVGKTFLYEGQAVILPIAGPASQQLVVTQANHIFTWQSMLAMVWLAGIVGTLCFMLYSNFKFAYLAKRNRRTIHVRQVHHILLPLCRKLRIKYIPKVYLLARIGSPCVFGFFRPCIYLNESAFSSENSLYYVLLHELCHIKQRDNIWILFRNAICIVFWFNPLVWIAGYFSHRDCELACDAQVLSSLDHNQRQQYGYTLVSILRSGSQPFITLQTAATLTMGKKEMKERILMIAKKPKGTLAVVLIVFLFVAAAVLVACTAATPYDNTVSKLEPTATISPSKATMPIATSTPTTTSNALVEATVSPSQSAAQAGETATHITALPPVIKPTGNSLEELVEVAALERYKPYGGNGVVIVAPHVYDKYEEGDMLTIWATVRFENYILYGNKLVSDNGGVVPAAIKLRKNSDGSFSLSEYIEAKDGSLYVTSIQEFCKPKDHVADEIIKRKGCDDLPDIMRENLVEYLKINNLFGIYLEDIDGTRTPLT